MTIVVKSFKLHRPKAEETHEKHEKNQAHEQTILMLIITQHFNLFKQAKLSTKKSTPAGREFFTLHIIDTGPCTYSILS